MIRLFARIGAPPEATLIELRFEDWMVSSATLIRATPTSPACNPSTFIGMDPRGLAEWLRHDGHQVAQHPRGPWLDFLDEREVIQEIAALRD